MKKGDLVQINDYAKKPKERENSWTETGYKRIRLEEGMKLYHISADEKINCFSPMVTCFFRSLCDPALPWGYVYEITILEGVEGLEYCEEDVRIDLNEVRNKVEIKYMGTIAPDPKNYSYRLNQNGDKIDRICTTKYMLVSAKKNKELEKENRREMKEKRLSYNKETKFTWER